MVVVGIIFLATRRDVLVLVGVLIFMVLRWIGFLGPTPHLGHGFLSSSHIWHQILLLE